mgnify:CR=1 FL=1
MPNSPSVSQMVTADIVGQVIDEDGNPIHGAVVKTSTHTFITDSDGVFQFINIDCSKNKTVVEVNKPTFFKGFRTMYIIANQDNYTVIRMIEKKNPSHFNANSGGTIQVNGGGSISFSPHSIVNKSSGAPYTGNVTVYSTWIDPSSNQLGELIPGALRGIDESEEEKLLESYGMVAAELFDDNNQALQIAQGSTATITFPITASLGVNAPNSIPLWYFDESSGMWKEQGSAQKQGNNYVGEVTHFSFWNCDVPSNFIHFEATFKNPNGTPLANVDVKITNTANSTFGYARTNSYGTVDGAIPKNANLILEAYSIICGATFHTQNLTTGTSDITLNNIIINIPISYHVTLSGTILNCTNNICKNGYVKCKIGNTIRFVRGSSNGNFYSSIVECNTPVNAKLTAYDYTEGTYGLEATYVLNAGLNQLGNLSACGNSYDQFVKWENTINGVKTSHTITDIGGLFEGGIFFDFGVQENGIAAGDSLSIKAVSFSFDGAPSTSGNHYLVRYGDHLDSDLVIDTSYSYINTSIPVILTKYEAIGGKIEGSFNGHIKGLNIPDRNVNCTFRVNRTN